MTLRCELDGNTRQVVDEDSLGRTLHCGWCGQYERQDYEPTTQNLLQREYDR